jgi:hypothetical protein
MEKNLEHNKTPEKITQKTTQELRIVTPQKQSFFTARKENL